MREFYGIAKHVSGRCFLLTFGAWVQIELLIKSLLGEFPKQLLGWIQSNSIKQYFVEKWTYNDSRNDYMKWTRRSELKKNLASRIIFWGKIIFYIEFISQNHI